jgi:hypothetical protein
MNRIARYQTGEIRMNIPKGASMSLTLKDGKAVLVVEPTTIETRAEAAALAALIEKFAASLPETRPRQSRISRPTAKPDGDEAEAEAPRE